MQRASDPIEHHPTDPAINADYGVANMDEHSRKFCSTRRSALRRSRASATGRIIARLLCASSPQHSAGYRVEAWSTAREIHSRERSGLPPTSPGWIRLLRAETVHRRLVRIWCCPAYTRWVGLMTGPCWRRSY